MGFGATEGIITARPEHVWSAVPTVRHANGGRFMRLSPLAGLRFGDEALFATGRARTFGSDDTPDSSLVGRWKGIPLLSLSGGRWAIGQAQHRERHAHHRVITPAVARPYISPGQVTDQATGSTLTGVVVFMAEWSYTRRYVTDALAALYGGKLVAPANSDPAAGGTPTARTDAETIPRVAASCPPGPQTPRFARRVEALDVEVLARGAIAVPGRCTCIDSHPQRVLTCA